MIGTTCILIIIVLIIIGIAYLAKDPVILLFGGFVGGPILICLGFIWPGVWWLAIIGFIWLIIPLLIVVGTNMGGLQKKREEQIKQEENRRRTYEEAIRAISIAREAIKEVSGFDISTADVQSANECFQKADSAMRNHDYLSAKEFAEKAIGYVKTTKKRYEKQKRLDTLLKDVQEIERDAKKFFDKNEAKNALSKYLDALDMCMKAKITAREVNDPALTETILKNIDALNTNISKCRDIIDKEKIGKEALPEEKAPEKEIAVAPPTKKIEETPKLSEEELKYTSTLQEWKNMGFDVTELEKLLENKEFEKFKAEFEILRKQIEG